MPFNFVNGLKVRGMDIESLIPGIEGIPEAGSKYQFAGNGSNKVFTLPVSPYNKDAVDVYVKQLYVHPDDYTLAGDVVTLTEAPPALDAGETYNVVVKVSLTTLNGYVNANRVSFEGENLDDILEKGKPLANYSNLRAYVGAATQVRITDPGIAGFFYYDASDTTSVDNGGTIIVSSNGKRWKRLGNGSIYPEWFGAKGDGVTNDRDALYSALHYSCYSGKRFMGGGGNKIYKIDSAISIDRTGMPPVVIDWNGSSVFCNNAGITFTGPAHYLTTSLTADPVRGDPKLKLQSVLGLSQGDLIEIESPAITQGTINTLHYYLVSELDGNDAYIEGTVVADINNQQIIDSGKTGSIVVRAFKLNKAIRITNGNFTVVDSGGAVTSLLVRNNYYAVVDNMTFDGHCRNQMSMLYNGHDLVTRIRFRDFGYINKDIGYSNLPAGSGTVGNPVTNSPSTGDAGLSYGYGVLHARSYSSIVRDVVAGHGWHATDASRGQMHILYDTVISSRNGFGCSTHEGSWHVTWKNCSFRGIQGITAGRCAFPTVENCSFIDTRVHGIVTGNYNLEVTIRNNVFDIQNSTHTTASHGVYADPTAAYPGPGSASINYSRLYTMENNVFYGHHVNRAGFASAAGTVIGFLSIKNNTFVKSSLYEVTALTHTSILGNSFNIYSGQFGITLSKLDSNTSLQIVDNIETGGSVAPNPAFMSIKNSGSSMARSIIKGNSTTGVLLRMDTAITIDEVSQNSSKSRCLLGNNTQTIKNKLNNIQGFVDYQVAVTNSVNNAVMTL